MAETTVYPVQSAYYRRDGSSWWDPLSGGRVATNTNLSGTAYQSRLSFAWAEMRAKSAKYNLVSGRFYYYRSDSYSATNTTRIRFWNSSQSSLSDTSSGDSKGQGWHYITLASADLTALLGSAAYINTYGSSGNYIEFYVNGSSYPAYLRLVWELKDTASKTTIYSAAASQGSSPAITHTALYRAVREGANIRVFLEIQSTIASGSSLGGGVSVSASASFPGRTASYISGHAVIKAPSVLWNSAGTLMQSAYLEYLVTGVNGATSISIKTVTSRSDSSPSGAHERTNTIAVPAATPAPSVAAAVRWGGADISVITYTATLQLVATSASGGATSISSYAFQHSLNPTAGNPTWVTFATSSSSSANFTPSHFTGEGATIGFRIVLTNAWGMTATSAVRIIKTRSKPTAPYSVGVGVSVVPHTSTEFGLSWSANQGADYSVSGYKIGTSVNFGTWTYETISTTALSVVLPRTLPTSTGRGQSVRYAIHTRQTSNGVTTESVGSVVVSVRLLMVPSLPGVPVVPSALSPTDVLTLSYGASNVDTSSALLRYVVEVSRNNGDWYVAYQGTSTSPSYTPRNIYPDLASGDVLRHRVYAVDAFFLESPRSATSANTTIRAGRMYVKLGAEEWVLGDIYSKIAENTWVQANVAAYIKLSPNVWTLAV